MGIFPTASSIVRQGEVRTGAYERGEDLQMARWAEDVPVHQLPARLLAHVPLQRLQVVLIARVPARRARLWASWVKKFPFLMSWVFHKWP